MSFSRRIDALWFRRQFTILTTGAPEDIRFVLSKYVTPPAPHGVFRDWNNELPYMGEIDERSFSLLEKSRFGQGWPLELRGLISSHGAQTTIKVVAQVTPPELLLGRLALLVAVLFAAVVTFTDNSTFLRLFVFIISGSFILGPLFDIRKRAKKAQIGLEELINARA